MKRTNLLFFCCLMSVLSAFGSSVTISGIKYEYYYDNDTGEKWAYVDGASSNIINADVLSSVTIDGNTVPVTQIGWNGGFKGCSLLETITVPATIEFFGSTFEGCTSLKKVIVKDLKKWCELYFNNKEYNPLVYAHHIYNGDGETEITHLAIPSGLTSIGWYAFAECKGLKSVYSPWLENTLKTIAANAFLNCTELEYVHLPNSVTAINYHAFYGCGNLNKVVSDITVPFNLGEDAFTGISSDAVLVVPVGTKSLYETAGWGKYFQTIIEKGGSTTIGDFVYTMTDDGKTASVKANSQSITSMDILGEVNIGGVVFKVNTIKSMSKCTKLSEIIIPEFIEYIDDQAFFGCTGLRKVVFEDGDKQIMLGDNKYSDGVGGGLFQHGAIEEAYIGRNINWYNNSDNRKWESAPFYDPSNDDELLQVSFGEKVTSVEEYLLCGCKALATVNVPACSYKLFSENNYLYNAQLIPQITMATQWKTYCATSSFAVPEGLEAYIVKSLSDDGSAVTLSKVTTINEGQGVLLNGEAGTTYKVSVVDAMAYGNNMLVGVTEPTDISNSENGYINFILYNGEFRRTSGGILPAYRAYLPLLEPEVNNARILSIIFENETTGIEIISEKEDSDLWYTISGISIKDVPKNQGLYIKNGKKVIIK